MEKIAIIAPIPMIIPSMVSIERILWDRMEFRATKISSI